MTKLLFIKLLRDLKITWGRMVMMVVAIGLSLIVFSGMLYALSLVRSNMTSGYMSTNPASARITLESNAKPEQFESIVAAAKAEPGVIDATMRSVVSLKLQREGADPAPLQLFVAAPDDPMRIATFKIKQSSWPPPRDGILLEQASLESLNMKVGDKLTVIGFDGKPVKLKIVGAVHDQSLALAGQEGGVGYLSSDTLPLLGKPAALDQVAITVADQAGQTEQSRNRDTIVRTALGVADRLKQKTGVEVEQIAAPTPYEHPHQQISNTILIALLAFGALSLLLSAILIATMFNSLLTQHIPQIGIMKAIGARSSRILQQYLLLILLVSVVAAILALVPGFALGRALAQMLLIGAMNVEVTTLSAPLWVYGIAIGAGIGVPLLIALVPLVRASRRTVREALDHHGVVDRQGSITTRFFAWLGGLKGVNRMVLMAFRNILRRRGRFFLSVGLLATAGAIFVGGLNLMAGFQAIPNTVTDEHRWDVEVKLNTPTAASELTNIVSKVPGVTRVETWNSVPTSVQYSSETSVTRTYPDQGHGAMNLTAIPSGTSMFIPPSLLQGRWLQPGDIDAVVLSQNIWKTLPNIEVGDTIQLPVEGRLNSWKVVGIAKELAGASCPCVTQAGFEQAAARPGQANLVRIVTGRHDRQSRVDVGKAVTAALADAQIKAQKAQPIDRLVESTEGHSDLLVILILVIAIAIGAVGLIGLSSMMSTSVIERTREFGVMKAIGAPGATVRRLVIFEGMFIAAISCVVAAIPAVILTAAMGTGLGNLFFNAPAPLVISLQAILIWIVILGVGTALATLAPAARAARLTVREALAYL